MKKILNTNRNFEHLEMVERLRNGDCEAFAGMFHAHKARIYYICLCITNNAVQAEDLTRDVFLQVFRKLPTLKGDFQLSTWFFHSAISSILIHLRKTAQKEILLFQTRCGCGAP